MEQDRRLFSLILPSEDLPQEKTMYYRIRKGTTCSDGQALLFPAGSTLSFDCYYNVLDYATYRETCDLDLVEYHLSVRGNVTVSLFLSRFTDRDEAYEDVLLSETTIRTLEATEVRIPLSLSSLEGRGIVYPVITALSDAAFLGGYIEAATDPRQRIKVGIAITTFKREPFVKRNVSVLVRDLPAERFGVFVTDNGNTLSPADIPGARLIPNKNLGGSGGFTRGIMEVSASEGYTHILLTDDDITFESEVFRRTAALLSYATDPDNVVVGASMLVLDKPYLQYEFGSHWNGRFVVPRNGGEDERIKLSLLRNADPDRPAEYTAWWFNCFSVSLPERIGLPFPFFIKIDDVEYCYRAAGVRFVLMNGVGVLHEAFGNKYSAVLEYYAKRNELIFNALYPEKGGLLSSMLILCRAVAKALVFQRYFVLDLVYKAFDDFLAGPEAFARVDQEKLHAELRSLGEKYLTREELTAQGYDCDRPAPLPQTNACKLRKVLTLNGYLLPAKCEDYRLADITKEKIYFYYRARRVLQYNPLTEKGFVTTQKRGYLFRAGFRLVGYFFKMLFKYRKVARAYRAALPEIVSREAWRERLSL